MNECPFREMMNDTPTKAKVNFAISSSSFPLSSPNFLFPSFSFLFLFLGQNPGKN
jgi:hypothetical protein